jgi:hypothetical protein
MSGSNGGSGDSFMDIPDPKLMFSLFGLPSLFPVFSFKKTFVFEIYFMKGKSTTFLIGPL